MNQLQRLLSGALLVLTLGNAGGCLVADADVQADLVIAAYERDYGDVSDKEADCVHSATVRHVRRDNVDRCDSNAVGCTITGPLNVRIWIADDLDPQAEIYTLRHEYTHVLIACMTGSQDINHDVPEFGYSSSVRASGSLAIAADSL
jgi:hypothetical protein